MRTRGRLNPRELSGGRRRRICLLIGARNAPPSRRVCVVAARDGRAFAVRYARLSPAGAASHGGALDASAESSGRRSVVVRFALTSIGLLPGSYSWSASSSWTGHGCTAGAAACTSMAPVTGTVGARVVTVHAVGCTRPRERFVTAGPARPRSVALTFDDGPSPYTASILATLERSRVPATFFVIGREVAGREGLLRRELHDGDVVGDHTWSHPNVSGGGDFARSQLSATADAVRRAAGFTPCLFRAPYGAVSGGLFDVASALGMTTIQWNVDPRDWSLPGSAAIAERVTSAVRPGAIVIMHDGGGPRAETASALPTIIATLRRRGYSFDTVPALLGQRVVYAR